MTWNNRVFKHKVEGTDEYYHEVHEVYYNEDKKITAWTVESMKPYGETVDELIKHLEQMLNDVKKSKDDVLDYETLKPESEMEGVTK